MKNNIYKIFILLLFFLSSVNVENVKAVEPFNFDVTEVQILENGNKFIGIKKGTVTSDNGVIIDANEFEYDKVKLELFKVSDHLKLLI